MQLEKVPGFQEMPHHFCQFIFHQKSCFFYFMFYVLFNQCYDVECKASESITYADQKQMVLIYYRH